MSYLNNGDLQDFSDKLNIISQVNRLQILCLLHKNGELCVCDIYKSLDIKRNLASHHLNLLKNIGLLKVRKEGQKMMYSTNEKNFKEFTKNINLIFN